MLYPRHRRKYTLADIVFRQSLFVMVIYCFFIAAWAGSASDENGVDYNVLVVVNVSAPCYVCPECNTPKSAKEGYCITAHEAKIRKAAQWCISTVYFCVLCIRMHFTSVMGNVVWLRWYRRFNYVLALVSIFVWCGWQAVKAHVYGEAGDSEIGWLSVTPFECLLIYTTTKLYRTSIQIKPGAGVRVPDLGMASIGDEAKVHDDGAAPSPHEQQPAGVLRPPAEAVQ